MKQGFKILDADLHVIEPYDLYLKYMDPQWGDRIPRAAPRQLQAGDIYDFRTADGSPVRKPWREAPPKNAPTPSSLRKERRKAQIAPYYEEAVARQFDPVSQLKAMDRAGVDVAAPVRNCPPHADEDQE